MSEKEDIIINRANERNEAATANDTNKRSVDTPTGYAALTSSRRLAPPPQLPSGETVNAKNTLKSFAVPPAATGNEVINAQNTVRKFAVAAVPNNNDVDTNYEPPLQDEETGLEHAQEITTMDRAAFIMSGSNLPVAIEAQAITDTVIGTAMPLPNRKRLFLWLSAILLALVAAAAVGGYCAGGRCTSHSNMGGAPPTSSAPTSAPTTIAMNNRTVSIWSEVNRITLSGRNITYPAMYVDQPENLALQWLINDDPLKLAAETASDRFRLGQRYALLTLRFQSGVLWNKTTGWLTAMDECD